MASERSSKRQKTDSSVETPTRAPQSNQKPFSPDTSSTSATDTADLDASKTPQRSSWYSSWSRKAPPITEVTRQSIKSGSSALSEVASAIKDITPTPKSSRSPSLAMTLGKGRPSRATLANATTTMVHAEARSPARSSSRSLSLDLNDTQTIPSQTPKAESTAPSSDNATATKEEPAKEEESNESVTSEPSNPRSSWLGWLAKGDSTAMVPSKLRDVESQSGPQEPQKQAEEQNTSKPAPEQVDSTGPIDTQNDTQVSRKGWLSMWNASVQDQVASGTAENTLANQKPKSSDSKNASESIEGIPIKTQEPLQPQTEEPSAAASLPPSLPQDGTKASAWAFWSRDRKANSSSTSVDKPREGELAVSDTPSQNQPRRASISVPKSKALAPEPKKPEAKQSEAKQPESTKPEPKIIEPKPVAEETTAKGAAKTEDSKTTGATPTKSHKKQDSKTEIVSVKAESSNAKARATEPEVSKTSSTKTIKKEYNLLLPSLQTTLRLTENPSLLHRLASLLYATKEPEPKHLSLVKDPPRIKNALAIGVHGYFPAPLIRSVLGQPTGTSIKFADMAAKSIKRWTSARGYECQVKTAALEGEGKIAERLELLWKLLLNWIEEIRRSDFIMIACHSQGVPVAIMLAAKLIQFGCVNSTRICICAMAGVNMGPFPEYKSRWIGGSAGELFEFSDPSSRVSTDYLAALDTVLKFGVHLTFIGSIDDQLVSLESSIYAPVTHPHIFRAVSIDSRVHAPNFLSHLVGFALKLRNLGVQDHGLVRELSSPLAGSLYTGEGHSRIYEDEAVYDLALSFSLETNALVGIPNVQRTVVTGGSNPYILPFAMRGILEEDFVRNELQGETSELLKEFDDWKPTSKVLKDVKFRLEGVRSKL